MKKILYILSVAAVLSACSSNDLLSPDMPPQEGNLLELDITAGDFRTDGSTPGTRATDNGPATTFENGDLVGVIAVQNGTLMYNNIPYRYNSLKGTWSFASGTDSKTTPCYYDPQFTYIVYYPYSNTADGVATIEGLKEKFVPQTDQRSKEAYRASDLLVSTSAATSRTLTAELTHAYASVSLSPEVKCTLLNNSAVSYISTKVSDVYFTIGSDICLPFRAKDGSFRYILPDATSAVRWFYTFEGKTYGGSLALNNGLVANTRYVRRELLEDKGTYTLDKAQTGDFYCTYTDNNEIKGLLIPGDAASLLNELNCIGIVFKAGKDDSDDSSYPNSMTVHGYVVALVEDANSGKLAWANKDDAYSVDVGTSTSDSDWKGYSNCQTIKSYITDGWSIENFPAANACLNFGTADSNLQYAAPTSSRGWFLPSVGQLKYLYNNREYLSGKIDKLKTISGYEDIKWFSEDWYWSSSEYSGNPASYAWCLNFDNGNVNYGHKNFHSYVRSVLAF